MKTLIFSDMDGTLLDHKTYDFSPASSLILTLQTQHIPLILTTSKTKAEVLWWQEKLGIRAPFIPENGSAIYIPVGYDALSLPTYPANEGWHCIALGKPYPFITAYLSTVADKYGIQGFKSMDIAAVARHTGLDEVQARLAKEREFSEPFLMEEPDLVAILREEARLYGLTIVEGGRFFHCLGHGADKGAALQLLTSLYRRHGHEVHTIALGDSPNDLSMLRVAHTPILLPNPSRAPFSCHPCTPLHAPHSGPLGWASALKEVLCL